MRLYCFRYPKNRVTDILLSLICIFIIVLILQKGESSVVSMSVDEQEGRIGFFYENNFYVDPYSEARSEVLIPEKFDETFIEYNNLQLSQGFDLRPYAGKRVVRYSYNLQEFENTAASDSIFATLYVFDGKIIAADIYSPAIDGFMMGVINK